MHEAMVKTFTYIYKEKTRWHSKIFYAQQKDPLGQLRILIFLDENNITEFANYFTL